MVTSYHRAIENALIEFGKEKGVQTEKGNCCPLSIVEPKSKFVVNYQPDVFFVLKSGKKLIFEVLETETKKQDIIIADISRACLLENIKGIIFIYNSKKQGDEIRILEALYVVVKGFNKKGIAIEKLPEENNYYMISKVTARNKKKLRAKLCEFCKDDKWLK